MLTSFNTMSSALDTGQQDFERDPEHATTLIRQLGLKNKESS